MDRRLPHKHVLCVYQIRTHKMVSQKVDTPKPSSKSWIQYRVSYPAKKTGY